MKFLIKTLLIISALISFVIFLLFVLAFVAWLNGAGVIFLPGLGLVVAMPLAIALLFIMLVISVSITILLRRVVSKRLP